MSTDIAHLVVYLNGQYVPLKDASISVLDRGFLLGDGVYEVVHAYHGAPFALDEHLSRLDASLAACKIPLKMTHEDWKAIVQALLEKNASVDGDQLIYLHITRGVAGPERCHRFPDDLKPTVFAQVTPFSRPSLEYLQQGFEAITADDIRWTKCHIKSTSLLPNVLLSQQAYQAGAIDVILLRHSKVIECASSNVFIVESGAIATPPLKDCMLGGITREQVVQLARDHGIPCAERTITDAALYHADEIWVTSSLKEIAPIVRLNGQPVGNGQAGPLWQKMIALYHEQVARLCKA